MNDDLKPLGTLVGRRSKTRYKFLWHRKDHHVYVERPGFFGTKIVKTEMVASSWEMAYHAAEAYVFDK